ncbi:TVP38/TMEM64 family membrane protein, partial [Nymphaea thermarum]
GKKRKENGPISGKVKLISTVHRHDLSRCLLWAPADRKIGKDGTFLTKHSPVIVTAQQKAIAPLHSKGDNPDLKPSRCWPSNAAESGELVGKAERKEWDLFYGLTNMSAGGYLTTAKKGANDEARGGNWGRLWWRWRIGGDRGLNLAKQQQGGGGGGGLRCRGASRQEAAGGDDEEDCRPWRRRLRLASMALSISWPSAIRLLVLLLLLAAITTACVTLPIEKLGGGYLFGLPIGFLADSIGATIGATAAFLLGRTIGKPLVMSKLKDYPQFQAVAIAIQRSGFKIVLLLRLVPLLPFNMLNYLLSVTPPITFALVYVGTTLKDLSDVTHGWSEISTTRWNHGNLVRPHHESACSAAVAVNHTLDLFFHS